jgi:hypothetical protein
MKVGVRSELVRISTTSGMRVSISFKLLFFLPRAKKQRSGKMNTDLNVQTTPTVCPLTEAFY